MRSLLLAGSLLAVAALVAGLRGLLRGRRRRTSLEAAGLDVQKGPPDPLDLLDRLSLRPEPVLWHARVSRPLDAWICGLASGPVVVWRSALANAGALALRPHAGEAFAFDLARHRYRRLVLLRAATLPEPYDRLDVFLEPVAATVFLDTGVGDACIDLIGRGLPISFEYQDGACRLRLDRLSFESPADYDTAASAAAVVEAGLQTSRGIVGAGRSYRLELEAAVSRNGVPVGRIVM